MSITDPDTMFMDAIEQLSSAYNQSTKQCETKVAQLQKRLAQAESKNAVLSSELAASRSELAATTSRLEQVEQDLRSVTQENLRLSSTQREQERKLHKLEHFKRSIVNTLTEEDKQNFSESLFANSNASTGSGFVDNNSHSNRQHINNNNAFNDNNNNHTANGIDNKRAPSHELPAVSLSAASTTARVLNAGHSSPPLHAADLHHDDEPPPASSDFFAVAKQRLDAATFGELLNAVQQAQHEPVDVLLNAAARVLGRQHADLVPLLRRALHESH